VLSRFAPNGVAIESTAVQADEEDEGRPIGPLRVCAYLPVDDRLEETRRKLEESLWYLGRIRPLPAPQYQSIQEADWAEAWKEHYHPVAIGSKLIIVPAWLANPEPQRIPIRMDPGMAFGTGTHPTTRLCLEMIEALFDEGRRKKDEGEIRSSFFLLPSSVIDIGCGSGILSVAALKLGAGHALGVDIDPLAVDVSRENAALNGVPDRFEAGLGSVDEIRQGKFSLQTAPVVLANILAPVIVRLLDGGLGELLEPRGVLILSGIITDQAPGVEAALSRHRLNVIERHQEGDWVALLAS
jgi:ribosomal protein L11 methyltransferase